MVDEMKENKPLFEIDDQRVERNRLLSATDQMMVPDRPTDKSAWAEYRQMLRDLPESVGWPDNIEWPQKPE